MAIVNGISTYRTTENAMQKSRRLQAEADARAAATPSVSNNSTSPYHIQQNAVAGANSGGYQTRTEAMSDLKDSADARGRIGGLWTPNRYDPNSGELIAAAQDHWTTAPLDGELSGLDKQLKYQGLNAAGALGSAGLAANKSWQQSLASRGDVSVDARTTMAQAGNPISGLAITPQYDSRSSMFGEDTGLGDVEGDYENTMGFQNPMARQQEVANAVNQQTTLLYNKYGGTEPEIVDVSGADETPRYEIGTSSGSDTLDQLYLSATVNGSFAPYEGRISSLMNSYVGAAGGGDDIRTMNSAAQDQYKNLSAASNNLLQSFGNEKDSDQISSVWDQRMSQKEEERDAQLGIIEKQGTAQKERINSQLRTEMDKNTSSINEQMQTRLDQLETNGQLNTDAEGNLTAASQLLIDKITKNYETKLDEANSALQTAADDSLLAIDSAIYQNQLGVNQTFSDFQDSSTKEQAAAEAQTASDEADRQQEILTALIKQQGADETTAKELASIMGTINAMSSDMIRAVAPSLLSAATGREMTQAEIESLVSAKEAEEVSKQANKTTASTFSTEITPEGRAWLGLPGNQARAQSEGLSIKKINEAGAVNAAGGSQVATSSGGGVGGWLANLLGGGGGSSTTAVTQSAAGMDPMESVYGAEY